MKIQMFRLFYGNSLLNLEKQLQGFIDLGNEVLHMAMDCEAGNHESYPVHAIAVIYRPIKRSRKPKKKRK